MKRLVIFAILLLLICGCAINEEQKKTWRRFWAVKTEDAQQQDTPGYQARPFSSRRPLTTHGPQAADIKNAYQAIRNELMRYKLQKKTFSGPYGETEFEFVLRRTL